jgi:hypothetical protein
MILPGCPVRLAGEEMLSDEASINGGGVSKRAGCKNVRSDFPLGNFT